MTALEAAGIVYKHLQGTLFTDPQKPTGRLCLYQRPDNSTAEDVVVNTLPFNREAIQEGILNVNLYVPNLGLTRADGSKDWSQPDIKRLAELATLANEALKDVSVENKYFFEVQQDNLFADENNQHFVNFRVEFKALNVPVH